MSKKQVLQVKPFLSVLIVMLFLFIFAFIQIENRRMGYNFMSLTQKEKEMRNQQRVKAVALAKMQQPERVQLLATQKLPMRKANPGQIIQMTSGGLAIVQ